MNLRGKNLFIEMESKLINLRRKKSEDIIGALPILDKNTTAEPTKQKRNLGFINGPPLPDSFFDPLPEEELQLWGL